MTRITFNVSLRPASLVSVLTLIFTLTGCRTGPPLPPADFATPGWHVVQGQAVWRKNRHATELAGDLLFATTDDGRTFVQFSKNPFPLIVAQSTPQSWEVKIPVQNRTFSGRGRPPARLFWLSVPRVLSGQGPPPRHWSFRQLETNHWRLENSRTGEYLEGFTSR